MTRTAILVSAFGFLAAAAPARAEDEEGQPVAPLHAIQARKFRMDHELQLAGCLLPLDPFYKGVAGVASYTYHFNEVIAWEVARGFYSYNMETKLKRQLVADFQYPDSAFEQLQWGASTALVVTPAYGKYSLSNESVVHAELFAAIGATVVKTSMAIKPGPILGLGVRVFLTEAFSVRLDGRYELLMGRSFTNVVSLSLGFGIDFGHAD